GVDAHDVASAERRARRQPFGERLERHHQGAGGGGGRRGGGLRRDEGRQQTDRDAGRQEGDGGAGLHARASTLAPRRREGASGPRPRRRDAAERNEGRSLLETTRRGLMGRTRLGRADRWFPCTEPKSASS